MLTRRVVGDPGAPDRGRSGKVVNFLKHQRINRPNASKLKDYWEFSECSVSTHGALSEDSHPEGKGRGREEEGKRNRERHPKSEMGKDVCDRFTRWYEGDGNGYRGYPRKVGRGAAEKAFAAVNPTEDLLDQMIQATKGQASSPAWVKDGGQFIPHPATWLNQRRWRDRPRWTCRRSASGAEAPRKCWRSDSPRTGTSPDGISKCHADCRAADDGAACVVGFGRAECAGGAVTYDEWAPMAAPAKPASRPSPPWLTR